MNSSKKALYGCLAFLPIISVIGMIAYFFSQIPDMIPTSRFDEPDPRQFFENMMGIMLLGILVSMLSIAALIVYIVHAVNNKRIDSGERVMWILLFVFLNGIAQPIYFFMRVMSDEQYSSQNNNPLDNPPQ
jgi:hypothetical protein